MIYYDTERDGRLSEQPWFNCAKCGKEVRQSDWASLCQDCGEEEEEQERRQLYAEVDEINATLPDPEPEIDALKRWLS